MAVGGSYANKQVEGDGAVPYRARYKETLIYSNPMRVPVLLTQDVEDVGTQYQGIPFGPQAGTGEFRFSARQSRIAALVEAPITPGLLAAGYGEFDFLGSGVTSNENESNSFVPRIRHLYGTLDLTDYGLHLLAGQTWSLATMNSKGITPRNEVTPPTIDSQYVPGFVWKLCDDEYVGRLTTTKMAGT